MIHNNELSPWGATKLTPGNIASLTLFIRSIIGDGRNPMTSSFVNMSPLWILVDLCDRLLNLKWTLMK